MQTLLVLDTNAFLHGSHFEQVDWCANLKATNIVLVVFPVVLGELDQLKWQASSAQLRDRAKRIASAIGKIVRTVPPGEDAPLRDGVKIRHVGINPKLAPEVDPRNRDEVLQASIDSLKGEGKRVLFLSLDENAALIARGRGTDIVEPWDGFIIPSSAEGRQQPSRPRLEIALSIRGHKLNLNNQAPSELRIEIPRRPTDDDLNGEVVRSLERQDIERRRNARALAEAFGGRRSVDEPWIAPTRSRSEREEGTRRAVVATALARRTQARRLPSTIQITNVGRSPATSVTLESFDVALNARLLNATCTQPIAGFQNSQLLEGQTFAAEMNLELADDFVGGVVKIRFACVCVELARLVHEFAFRITVEESANLFG